VALHAEPRATASNENRRPAGETKTEGRISIQTLEGRIQFSTAERSLELVVGEILTLEHDISHDVEGIVDSAFLLTIAWRDTSSVR